MFLLADRSYRTNPKSISATESSLPLMTKGSTSLYGKDLSLSYGVPLTFFSITCACSIGANLWESVSAKSGHNLEIATRRISDFAGQANSYSILFCRKFLWKPSFLSPSRNNTTLSTPTPAEKQRSWEDRDDNTLHRLCLPPLAMTQRQA